MTTCSCADSAKQEGMSTAPAELLSLLTRLVESVTAHGDWTDYDQDQVFDAVAGEFDEYREAFVTRHLSGRHGQIDELHDLVVTAIKGIRRLTLLEGGKDGTGQ